MAPSARGLAPLAAAAGRSGDAMVCAPRCAAVAVAAPGWDRSAQATGSAQARLHRQRQRLLPVLAVLAAFSAGARAASSFAVLPPAARGPPGGVHATAGIGLRAATTVATAAPPRHGDQPGRGSRLPMFGILDDMGKGLMNAAASAVTGMDDEDRNELVKKMAGGNGDFNDYLKMVLMLKNAGGASGIVNTMSKVPGLSNAIGMDDPNLDEAETKLTEYTKVIEAMTPEQREQPGYFLHGDQKGEYIKRVATASGVDEAVVQQFLNEFRAMRKFFVKMGSGKSGDQIAKEMEAEIGEEERPQTLSSKSKNTPYVNPKRKKKKLLARSKAAATKKLPVARRGSR